MNLDTRIPLGFQMPDMVNSLAQGAQAGQFVNDARHQNAFRNALAQHGAGLVAGESTARNALAGFDPAMVQQADANRQTYRQNEQAMQMAYQSAQLKAREFGAQIDAQQRAQLADEFKRGANMIAAAQSPEQFAQIMQLPGVAQAVEAFVGPNMASFENRQVIASAALGAAEAMKVMGGNDRGFRQATPEEAGQYGAAAGQFGPDGRFYPINPPSSTSMEMGPDGVMRVTQGPGAGSKPFTEGQSKDVVYATRARGALEAFEPVADAMASRTDRVLDYIPLGIGREMQSSDFQTAQNAGNEFLQAILRKDTGAAITRDEQILYGETFLPQPGDSPQVLEFKRAARQRALAAIEAGMGPSQILAQERALQNGQGAPAQAAPQAPAGSQADDLSDDDLLRMYGVQ